MKLFNKKITSRKHSPNDKHYHAVVDVKRGLKASDSLSFMTSDIHTGVLTLELIDGDLPYSVIGCKVSATISCPDSTVLEIPCEMLDDNVVEIHLGIEGTYQEGIHTFDLKIDRGNARIVGIPTLTYTVLSSIVEKSVDDDKFQILDKLISQTKDRLDRFDVAMSGMTSDSEVREARDGENLLYDRLKRDLDYSKSINAKVEQVAESVTELESNVGNIVQSNLTQLGNRITQVDNRVTQVDNRVTQEVNTINSSIADLNLKVDHVAQIDDELVSPYRTWSSEKIDNELSALENELSALELVASNVKMSDDSSVEDAINTNKTNISSLQTDVDNIYGGNKKLSSDHFVKSYPGKYFSSVTTEKDLNNIKFNIICYTTSGDGLTNLPSGESGGGGMLEVTQSFANSNSLHVIQRYTNTITNATYIRSFNKDKDVWTHWGRNTVGGQATKMTEDNGVCRGIPNNNANDINITGFWMGSNVANVPSVTHSWVYIESLVHNDLYQVQKATDLHESSKRWTRHKTSGSWSEWREL